MRHAPDDLKTWVNVTIMARTFRAPPERVRVPARPIDHF